MEMLGHGTECDEDAVEQVKASPAQDEEHQSQPPASQEGLQREAHDLQVKQQPVRHLQLRNLEPGCLTCCKVQLLQLQHSKVTPRHQRSGSAETEDMLLAFLRWSAEPHKTS